MSIPQITALARQVARSDPDDVREQTLIHEEVRELKHLLQRSGAKEVAQCLDVAGTLTDALSRGETLASRRMVEVVGMLMRVVEWHFGELRTKAVGKQDSLSAASPVASSVASPGLELDVVAWKPEESELPKINNMVVGEVLIQLGFVERHKLLEAMDLQNSSGMRMGDALIACGAATHEQIEIALRLQKQLSGPAGEAPPPEPTAPVPRPSAPGGIAPAEAPVPSQERLASEVLLGEVMVHLGFVTPSQVEHAIEIHRERGLRVGEALVELGYVDWDHVVDAIAVQKRMRHASGLSGS